MALIQDKYCYECKMETQHINWDCVKCMDRAKRVRIASWNALTVDERLHDIRERLEKLERGEARY
jgi:hypothetical protein